MYEEDLHIDATELAHLLTYCPSTYTIRSEVANNPEPIFLVINDFDQTISLIDDLDEFYEILNDTVTGGKIEYTLAVEDCDSSYLRRVCKETH